MEERFNAEDSLLNNKYFVKVHPNKLFYRTLWIRRQKNILVHNYNAKRAHFQCWVWQRLTTPSIPQTLLLSVFKNLHWCKVPHLFKTICFGTKISSCLFMSKEMVMSWPFSMFCAMRVHTYLKFAILWLTLPQYRSMLSTRYSKWRRNLTISKMACHRSVQ